MTKIFTPAYLLLLSLPVLNTSCGSSSSNDSSKGEEIVVVTHDGASSPMETDGRKMSVVADSMALYADDLSPEQALTVLSTFYRVHLEARANGERRKDIQTMRKFIDVYDIVMANHRDELRRLMLRAYEADSTLNLPGAIELFKELLEDYDSAHGQGSEYVAPKRDSLVEQTDAPTINPTDGTLPPSQYEQPIEYRPAE